MRLPFRSTWQSRVAAVMLSAGNQQRAVRRQLEIQRRADAGMSRTTQRVPAGANFLTLVTPTIGAVAQPSK